MKDIPSEFWIKYQSQKSVLIDISYGKGPEGVLGLNTIDELISAYKALPGSPFKNTPTDQLSLHYTADSEAIPRNTFLPTIQDIRPFGSFRLPFFIKSLNDSIPMHEFMQFPNLNYGTVANPTTETPFKHRHIKAWTEFNSLVIDWIQANQQQHSKRIDKPEFRKFYPIEDKETLKQFIFDNLLMISTKCFIPDSTFRRSVETLFGEPDQIMVRDDSIVAVIELIGAWNFQQTHNESPAFTSALTRLHKYMRLNQKKYGILTSYESTWFVYRQDCSCCHCVLRIRCIVRSGHLCGVGY